MATAAHAFVYVLPSGAADFDQEVIAHLVGCDLSVAVISPERLAAPSRENGVMVVLMDGEVTDPTAVAPRGWAAERLIAVQSARTPTRGGQPHGRLTWPNDIQRLVTLLKAGQSRDADLPRWIVGQSAEFLAVLRCARRFARYDVGVLIEGETGTGKDVVARAIHYFSQRASKPFLPINCGAMPDHLFESEMFGHAAGAFTDARTAQPGLAAMAHGGTLFLDEVDALSPHAQISLLRFLQDGSYRNVGSSEVKTSNTRIVAATNRPLQEATARGAFREDLFFRLSLATVSLPALRERPDDILPLARHFLKAVCERYGSTRKSFSPGMLAWLVSQRWPGNIRQLQHAVERGYIFSDGDTVDTPELTEQGPAEPAHRAGGGGLEPFAAAKARVVAAFEKDYLTQLLADQHGNVTRAARLAHKERKAFDRLLRKHGIERAAFTSDARD
ncbi:sigma-54 interaction domain-containing protein [Mesorhizobium sp. IMUNJ 23232]|uniref:sigma-54 interaction domain-containing protein n=1 Tax=Mesorhizobium sp. IMUNJ 23232 TaxID=3376064 RepID=UPI0037875BF3